MDIKCNFNPNYFNNYYDPHSSAETSFRGRSRVLAKNAGECADIFVKRPVADKSATGLLSLVGKMKNFKKDYVKNIKHTYEHKIIFALIEKEIFGSNSIDSITHDADKMLLYMFGFPKSFVSKFHRNHSVHHAESGKNMNLRSIICDNIASSPEFKPEKKKSLRDHFNTSAELQSIDGLKELLEKYSYGEKLDFNKIKAEKNRKYDGMNGVVMIGLKTLLLAVPRFLTSVIF